VSCAQSIAEAIRRARAESITCRGRGGYARSALAMYAVRLMGGNKFQEREAGRYAQAWSTDGARSAVRFICERSVIAALGAKS
jgi:hypothetical protein